MARELQDREVKIIILGVFTLLMYFRRILERILALVANVCHFNQGCKNRTVATPKGHEKRNFRA